MIKKFIAIILGFGMLFSVVYAKEMVDSPHIYDFEDSAGTLWDKLPGDGATAQWRGYVTNSALETLIDSSVTDQKQGRYVSVFPSKSEHVIQHNFKPEWFMKDGKIEKIAFSFAVNFKNPDRLRQIYIYDENGKTATQLFEAKNNNGKVSMAYVGKWQTGVDEEGNPIFETDKSGNVIDRGVRYIEWNGVKNDWYYINYLIDIPSHSYQMRIIRKDGSISGGSINYGEHGVLHGNFKGAPSKIEFKTTAGRNGGEEAFLDDITFGGYSGELGIFGAKEVVPESKEISLKFANGFNSTGQPTRDKIKIMQTKVGDTKDIKNFEVENSPNSVKIKFAGDLESCADYKILFDESVKTVFGQEVSDYTFKTTGKKGMSYIKDFTFYDENDKVVNIDRIQANIAYTTITYDQPMDEGSLKNVKIDGADFNSTYNGENFTQTLTFNKALEPFKTYTIFADNNVVSSNGQQLENYKQEVTPVVGKYKIQTAVKQNNTEITRGSELVGGAMINVKSVVDSSILVGNQNLNMSVMVIRDGCIENIKVAKSKIENAKSAELRMDLTLPINVENCIIKIMVMDEMFRPLTDAIEIN